MKYYTERLPEKYAIKTDEGIAKKYKEAIDIFNKINDTEYNGSYFYYYFNNGCKVDCGDYIYEIETIYTPTEFIDLLTKPDSKTDFEKEVSKMRYSEGDVLINDDCEERVIAAKVGATYTLAHTDYSTATNNYTQQELDDYGYQPKSQEEKEPSKIKLTLEDVAKMYGTDVSNIEIVQ